MIMQSSKLGLLRNLMIQRSDYKKLGCLTLFLLSRLVLTRNSVKDKSLFEVVFISQNGVSSNPLSSFYFWCLATYFACLCNRAVSCHMYFLKCWVYVSYQYFALIVSITFSCSGPFLLANLSIAPNGTPPRALASMLKNCF